MDNGKHNGKCNGHEIRTGNRILDRLPDNEYRHLVLCSDRVMLPHGHEIYRQNGPMSHVYFPTRGVGSVVLLMEEGKEIETATVGNEGMIGVPAYLGLDFSPSTSLSQVSGEFLRLSTANLHNVTRQAPKLDALLRRYTAFSLRQADQTVACSTLHRVEERMCRWLLAIFDRIGHDEFLLTHEFLAYMLGVRRQTVTVVAGELQKSGLISYRRGMVRILDREGLESSACECYAVSQSLYERIMHPELSKIAAGI